LSKHTGTAIWDRGDAHTQILREESKRSWGQSRSIKKNRKSIYWNCYELL